MLVRHQIHLYLTDKLGFTKNKILCLSKDTTKKTKVKVLTGRKHLEYTHQTKIHVHNTKELSQVNNNNNPQKGQKI